MTLLLMNGRGRWKKLAGNIRFVKGVMSALVGKPPQN